MKNVVGNLSWVVLVTAVISVAGASVARADERVVAKVPFAFLVGDVRLPAGEYVVEETSDGPGVVAIASADGARTVLTITIPASTSAEAIAQPDLVFEKFSDQYFLSRVDLQNGEDREIVLTPAIMEKDIARSAKAAD
jgi:hypothetical protein